MQVFIINDAGMYTQYLLINLPMGNYNAVLVCKKKKEKNMFANLFVYVGMCMYYLIFNCILLLNKYSST